MHSTFRTHLGASAAAFIAVVAATFASSAAASPAEEMRPISSWQNGPTLSHRRSNGLESSNSEILTALDQADRLGARPQSGQSGSDTDQSALNYSVVFGPKPSKEWIARESRKLDRVLAWEDISNADAGISVVRFNATPEGKPMHIRTVDRGPHGLDRVARSAVRNLRLGRWVGASNEQVYEAVIILADTRPQLTNLRRIAAAQAARRNGRLAASGHRREVVTLAAAAAN